MRMNMTISMRLQSGSYYDGDDDDDADVDDDVEEAELDNPRFTTHSPKRPARPLHSNR